MLALGLNQRLKADKNDEQKDLFHNKNVVSMTGAKLKIGSSVPTVLNPPVKNRTVTLANGPGQV